VLMKAGTEKRPSTEQRNYSLRDCTQPKADFPSYVGIWVTR
jgi:hypothetical protein